MALSFIAAAIRGESSATAKMYRYCEGNGFHLRDENGELLVCHYNQLVQ